VTTVGRGSGPLTLVTGATGFIGSRLLERLVADGGNVRVLARRVNPTLELLCESIDIKLGDIRTRNAVSAACEGVDVVYHLAGLAKSWVKDPAEFFAVNENGTENVCRAAEECGVRRVIHTSTALVTPPPTTRNGTEYTTITAYQRSKAAGEERVHAFVARGGDAVIVRPTRVFGPGLSTPANTVTRLIDLYRRGRFRFRIADGGARANYVMVDDVVEGILLAATRGTRGEAYALGGTDKSLPEFLQLIAKAGARPRMVFAVPRTIAQLVAFLYEMSAFFGVEPDITRDWARLLAVDWPVSSDDAKAQLGYAPTPIDEAARITLNWLEAGSPAPAYPFVRDGKIA